MTGGARTEPCPGPSPSCMLGGFGGARPASWAGSGSGAAASDPGRFEAYRQPSGATSRCGPGSPPGNEPVRLLLLYNAWMLARCLFCRRVHHHDDAECILRIPGRAGMEAGPAYRPAGSRLRRRPAHPACSRPTGGLLHSDSANARTPSLMLRRPMMEVPTRKASAPQPLRYRM